jgi:hypothetical protein
MPKRLIVLCCLLTACAATPGARAVAPYYYLGWGDPPDVRTVMQATGIRWLTLAFVIDGGDCEPSWDAERAITRIVQRAGRCA